MTVLSPFLNFEPAVGGLEVTPPKGVKGAIGNPLKRQRHLRGASPRRSFGPDYVGTKTFGKKAVE